MHSHEKNAGICTTSFQDLPRELKLSIFNFTPDRRHLGQFRLVNREWGCLVRPLMWQDYTTRLQGSYVYQVPPDRTGCFHDIRRLTLGGPEMGPNWETRFFMFLRLLRKDQLMEFRSCPETPLTLPQLSELLRSQSSLRTLRPHLDYSHESFNSLSSENIETSHLLSSTLRSLKILQVRAGENIEEDTHPDSIRHSDSILSAMMISAASCLEGLEVCDFRFPETPSQEVPMPFPKTFNFVALTTLKIEYCLNVRPFLQALTASIKQRGTSIRHLAIRTRDNDNRPFAAQTPLRMTIQELLCSFNGLVELELDCGCLDNLDWSTALATHHTLRKFLWSNKEMQGWAYYGTKVLATIIGQCPILDHLAIGVPILDLGSDTNLPPRLFTGMVISDLLAVIASAPPIRSLSLLDAPGCLRFKFNSIDRHDPTRAERLCQLMHEAATKILTDLYSKGSNIRWLAFSSANTRAVPRRLLSKDRNDHTYPNYYYEFGTVETEDCSKIETTPISRHYFTGTAGF